MINIKTTQRVLAVGKKNVDNEWVEIHKNYERGRIFWSEPSEKSQTFRKRECRNICLWFAASHLYIKRRNKFCNEIVDSSFHYKGDKGKFIWKDILNKTAKFRVIFYIIAIKTVFDVDFVIL